MPRLPKLSRAHLSLLTLGLVACGGSQPKADKSTSLEKPAKPAVVAQIPPDRTSKTKNTPASDVGVRLLGSGKEPRRKLKYIVTPNYKAVSRSRITITSQSDKSIARDRSFLVMALVDSTNADSFSVTYGIMTDQSGTLIDDVDQIGKAGVQNLGGTAIYTSWGRPTAFNPFADDRALLKQYQDEVMGLMNVPWLPAEPVGVGAKWKILTPASVAQPLRSNKVVTSELLSIEGSVITIETTTIADAPKQTVNGMPLEGQRVRATKRTTVDLADPVSVLPLSHNFTADIVTTRIKSGKAVTHGMLGISTSKRLGGSVVSN